jgi:hypothetical protein
MQVKRRKEKGEMLERFSVECAGDAESFRRERMAVCLHERASANTLACWQTLAGK